MKRARDIPGWARAVAESKARYDHMDLPYEQAGDIELPNAPAVADHAFAYDLAALLGRWGGWPARLRLVQGGAR